MCAVGNHHDWSLVQKNWDFVESFLVLLRAFYGLEKKTHLSLSLLVTLCHKVPKYGISQMFPFFLSDSYFPQSVPPWHSETCWLACSSCTPARHWLLTTGSCGGRTGWLATGDTSRDNPTSPLYYRQGPTFWGINWKILSFSLVNYSELRIILALVEWTQLMLIKNSDL